jgi:chaperonin GroES
MEVSKSKSTVKVTPLHDRVIVKPDAVEEKTEGGIIIPDTAKEKPQRGTIVSVGGGTGNLIQDEQKITTRRANPLTVSVGDIVLYGKYAGTEIRIEGQSLLIMRENDILAIV